MLGILLISLMCFGFTINQGINFLNLGNISGDNSVLDDIKKKLPDVFKGKGLGDLNFGDLGGSGGLGGLDVSNVMEGITRKALNALKKQNKKLPNDTNCKVLAVCDEADMEKLEVSFEKKAVACGELVRKNTTRKMPAATLKSATKGATYVLIMTDPDYLYHCAPSIYNYADKIHSIGILTADPKGSLATKTEVIKYLPPAPEFTSHRYQLFLYRWTSGQVLTTKKNANSRSKFKRSEFEKTNNLGKYIAFFEFRCTNNESDADFNKPGTNSNSKTISDLQFHGFNKTSDSSRHVTKPIAAYLCLTIVWYDLVT